MAGRSSFLPAVYLRDSPLKKSLPPIFLTISLLLIYLGTIAPGLTWANDGADGGDLISAAATGGIAHPSGYPLFLLLAGFFQSLPVGTLAFRTNLMSALAGVATALLVYGILVWVPDSETHGNWPAGLVAGFSIGLSPLLWSQAVITEVYTLHTAFAALSMLLLFLSRTAKYRRWLERLCGLALGLAVGNQLTSVFLIPPILLAVTMKGGWKLDFRTLLRVCSWCGIGLLVYLALPVRALSNPPINWGNPITFEQFKWLVTGELYQRRLLDITYNGIFQRSQALVTMLQQQFELPGILLALIGLIYYFKRSWLYFISIFNVVSYSLFAILYASFDSYIYLLPVFLSFAIWIGLGIGGLLQSSGKYRRSIQIGMLVLFAFWFAIFAISRWPMVDASQDQRAELFGAHAMQTLPQNAIVFTDSDQAIFALWYFHYALKQRPDLTVIATDLLQFDWYAHTLRTIYPSIDWSGDFLWQVTVTKQNPTHPTCYVSYTDKEDIACKPGAASGQ